MLKAVLFDLDGTVVDSTASDYQAWVQIFREYNVEFPFSEYKKVVGAKGTEIVQGYLRLSESETKDFLAQQEAQFMENCAKQGLQAITGVEELLNRIQALPLQTALATGSSDRKLNFTFEYVDLRRYFDVIITADTVSKGKPDPDVFLQAAGQLGVRPAQAMVLEDAPLGVKAAKDGGFHCVAITTTHNRQELAQADQIIDAYQELDLAPWLKRAKGAG